MAIVVRVNGTKTPVYRLNAEALGTGGGRVLHYKQKTGGFDSRWCHWNLSLT